MRRALQPSWILTRGAVLRGLLLRRKRSLGALLDVWDSEEESPEGERQHAQQGFLASRTKKYLIKVVKFFFNMHTHRDAVAHVPLQRLFGLGAPAGLASTLAGQVRGDGCA